MAIYRLLDKQAFGPKLVIVMTTAYEDVLRVLPLTHRGHPLTNIVARRIVELALTGERNPRRIREQVLHSLDQDLIEVP